MDSVTSSRARLAALTRHRGRHSMAATVASEELTRSRDFHRAYNALALLTPDDRRCVLASLEGEAPASV